MAERVKTLSFFMLKRGEDMATIDSLDIRIQSSAQKANQAIDTLVKNLGKISKALKFDTSGLSNIGKALNLGELGKSAKTVESQMQKISKSASEAAKEFQNKFKDIDVKVDFSKPEAELRKFQKQAQTAENSLSRVMASSSADKRIGEIERLSITLSQANNAVKVLENHMAGIQTAQPKLDFNITGAGNSTKFLIEYKKELMDFKNNIKSMSDVYGGLSNVSKGGLDTPIQNLKQSTEELKQSYPQATNVISAFEQELQKLQTISAGLTKEPTKVNVDTNSIEQAKIKMEEIKQKFTGKEINWKFTGNFEQLKTNLNELESRLAKKKQQEQEMISAGKIDVSGFEKLQSSISTIVGKIKILESLKDRTESFNQSLQNLKVPPIHEENLKKLQSTLKKTEEDTEKLRTKLSNAITIGNIVPNIDDSGFRRLTEQIALSEKQTEALKNKIKEVEDASEKENIGKLGKGLSGLSTNSTKVENSLNKASNSILNLSKRASSALNPINKMSSSFKSLMQTLIPILGIHQLFNWGKQSIKISSDLSEVQNIVNATFGDFKDKIEDLSKTSIKDFGMSELTAKQIASRFQAMGIAMGFGQEKMSDMSINLTKLAADMASFYNVEQDAVAKSLQSVFTGETEPLRKYGLDLTQATLQQWAMNQGINANIQSMSQAEKTLLRYQYVMSNTSAAQGDFARTADTWANQTRVLKQNLEQLASTIGGTLINAFKPLVKALNVAMGYINSFAKTVSNALGKIFGWKFEEGGGFADEWGSAVSSSEDIADSTGKASKNIKKMQAGLRAFDELKTINMPDDNTGSGGGGTGGNGTGGLGADIKYGDWIQTDSIFKDYESEIDTLSKLGEYIGNTLTDTMNSIDWDSVYKKAENFGSGLASFLNGLISPELFGALGDTISSSLNTALKFLDSFGKTFNFKNFGTSIGTGINKALKNIDWKTALSAAATWGTGIGNTINSFFKTTDFSLVGSTISNALNTAIQFALNLGTTLDFAAIGQSISDTINGFFSTFNFAGLAETLNVWVDGIWQAIKTAITGIEWITVWEGVKEFFSNLDLDTAVVLSIAVAPLALSGLTTLMTTLSDLKSKIGSVVETISSLGSFIGGLSTPTLAIIAVFAALAAGLVYVFATNEDVRKSFGEALQTIRDGLQPAIEFITDTVLPDLQAAWDRLLEILKPFGEFLNDIFISLWQDMINPALTYLGETIIPKVTEVFENLWSNILVPFGTFLGDILEPVIEIVSDALSWLWKDIGVPLAEFIGKTLGAAFEGLCDIFNDGVVPVVDAVIDVLQFLWDKVLSPIVDFLWDLLKPAFDTVFSDIGDAIDLLTEAFSGLIEFITDIFSGDWESAWKGIVDIFKGVFKGIASVAQNIINTVISLINGIINGFNNVTGIVGIPAIPTIKEVSFADKFEKGGLVLKHTFAEIGEHNKKEAVLPLENKRTMRMIADTILENTNYNSANNSVLDNGQIEELMRETRKQNQLLQQQNQLLQGILQKPTLGNDDVFNAARSTYKKEATRRYGNSAYFDPIWG